MIDLRKPIRASLAFIWLASTALAQTPPVPLGPSGGGGGGGGGSGTVTSISTTCGITGGPITTSGTISESVAINAQSGTTYTPLAADCGKLVTFSNAGAIAVTLTNANFVAGNAFYVKVLTGSVGSATFTPSSGTIDGAATAVFTPGQSALMVFDGTNWSTTGRSTGGGSGTVTSVATACGVSGGPITTSGTISGNVTTNSPATGSAYTFLASDCGKLVVFSDGTPRAPSLPSASFVAGNFINIENAGAGAETITPTTGTIGGAATLVLQLGQGVSVAFDGTNWQIGGGPYARGPASATSGHIATFNGTTGQLLQDGGAAGAVSSVAGDGTTVNCSPTTGAVVCNTLAPPPISPATTQTQVIALVDTVVALSSVAPSQNFTRCSPFKVPVPQHWDELLMGVTTLGTGPITVALYTDAIDSTSHRHQPQALIASSSGSFTVTGTGLITSAMGVSGTGIPIPAGLNWACTNDAAAADAVRYDAIGPTSTYFMNLLGAVQTVAVASLLGTSQIVSLRSNSTITSGTWNSAVGVTFLDDAQANPVNLGARIASVP